MRPQYLACGAALALLLVACAQPGVTSPSPFPSASSPSASAPSPAPPAVSEPIAAEARTDRHWYTLPDGLFQSAVTVRVTFAADPARTLPAVTLGGGGERFPLARVSEREWGVSVPLSGVAPGERTVEVLERVASGRGAADIAVARASFVVSQPEYAVWTLDFEGDAAGDAEMANTAAIADGLQVPMVVMWNPRAWTVTLAPPVSAERVEAMRRWTLDRASKGDEVALHLHMWTDFVRAAGVAPRTAPAWAGRSDGYDVPMTAYGEDEQRTLIEFGTRLMAERGLPRPTSFRGGGNFGNAAMLRAAAASGFSADCTAVPAGTFGRLPWPWTLPNDAQPYRPAPQDANATGDLPLLEAPTIGGNTYGHTRASIQAFVRADLAMLAPAGRVAAARRAITIVSHPGTIDATERAAIETLLHSFDPLRFDHDRGPLRFVTLRQLAAAYAP
ncbi:MAG: hypothetical protein M3O91_08160 [Chloroflexota bacterium]|nr:hypothetical protein [Chloroflexota bacterium]